MDEYFLFIVLAVFGSTFYYCINAEIVEGFAGSVDDKTIENFIEEEVQMVEAHSDYQQPRHMYIRLLRDTVAGTALGESELSLLPDPLVPGYLTKNTLDLELRRKGADWPWLGHTSIGYDRLNHVMKAILSTVLHDIPGDYFDTGAWKGGSSSFALGTYICYNASAGRKVWVADRFLTLATGSLWSDITAFVYPGFRHKFKLSEYRKSSLSLTRTNFYWLNLLVEERLKFVAGAYSETLPAVREQIDKLAVLRVKGEEYSTVMDILHNLYDKVSVGGWVIVDDYHQPDIAEAVLAFTKEIGLDATELIDMERHVHWVKTQEKTPDRQGWLNRRPSFSAHNLDSHVHAVPKMTVLRTLSFFCTLLVAIVVSGKIVNFVMGPSFLNSEKIFS